MVVALINSDKLISQHSFNSVLREVTVEHLFIGELLRRLWQNGVTDVEVLRSEFDEGGYDLVLSCGQITRHIQLKSKREGGSTAEVKVSQNLAKKPSGCVLWIVVTDNLELSSFLWFGGDLPSQPLPDISQFRIAKHTKGDGDGVKNERPNHRIVGIGKFTKLNTLDQVIDRLIGPDWAASSVADMDISLPPS